MRMCFRALWCLQPRSPAGLTCRLTPALGTCRQVEYYFSDTNLPTDAFMLKQIALNPEGYGALHVSAWCGAPRPACVCVLWLIALQPGAAVLAPQPCAVMHGSQPLFTGAVHAALVRCKGPGGHHPCARAPGGPTPAVPLHVILSFKKMRRWRQQEAAVAAVLAGSEELELPRTGDRVKRRRPLEPVDWSEVKTRTLLISGLPDKTTIGAQGCGWWCAEGAGLRSRGGWGEWDEAADDAWGTLNLGWAR